MSDKQKVRWAASSFFEDASQPGLRATDVQSVCGDDEVKDQAKLPSRTSNTRSSIKKQQCPDKTTQFKSGVDSFDPVSRKDLAMSKKRLEPLEEWFCMLQVSTKKNRVLLLLGPDGCGKTAAVHVLAREKNMEILDWSETDFIPGVDGYTPNYDVNSFKMFLCRAGRYTNSNKLIIAEDLPLSVLSARNELTTVIHEYSITGKSPLILIMSQTDRYTVFNAESQKKLDMDMIIFKRITDVNIKKALNRIISLKGLSSEKYANVVAYITETSCGNIRKAISELKFYVPESQYNKPFRSIRKFQKQLDRKTTARSADLELKEDSGIFHAVARVLYAKRESGSMKRGHGSNPETRSHGELEYKPVEICDKYFQLRKQFMSLMFCNYTKIFDSINDITNAAEFMSDSDLISSLWLEKPLSEDAGFIVAVGGVMTSCHNTVKKWHPLKTDGGLAVHNTISPTVLWGIRKTYMPFANLTEDIMCTEVIPSMTKMFHYFSMRVPKCCHGLYTHDHHQFILQMEQWKRHCNSLKGFHNIHSEHYEENKQLLDELEEDEIIIEEVNSD